MMRIRPRPNHFNKIQFTEEFRIKYKLTARIFLYCLWSPVRCNVWNLRWNLKQKPEIMKTRVTAIKPKKNHIGLFLSMKWRIYKYVLIRVVRFWFLTIPIQRDSFYTQAFFWFSYFKNVYIMSNLITLHEKNSLQTYKVQWRTKTKLKTTNQIPKSPLRMSSLVVVHCKNKL